MKRKEFTPGQAVEVQRDVGTPWEPAKYRKTMPNWRGWHSVELPNGRYIDSMTGTECKPDNPRALITKFLTVPSQRVRGKGGTMNNNNPKQTSEKHPTTHTGKNSERCGGANGRK